MFSCQNRSLSTLWLQNVELPDISLSKSPLVDELWYVNPESKLNNIFLIKSKKIEIFYVYVKFSHW